MMTPETGGILNRLLHFYHYEDLAQARCERKPSGAMVAAALHGPVVSG